MHDAGRVFRPIHLWSSLADTRDKASELAFHVEASPPVWLNLPPARVWIYRRQPLEANGVVQRQSNPAQEISRQAETRN